MKDIRLVIHSVHSHYMFDFQTMANNSSGSFQVPPPPPGPMSKEMIEKTQRSVFVGNIPYEATEEALVDVFSKAGPVVGFRLVYDRESGKPKGYGFCEYKVLPVLFFKIGGCIDVSSPFLRITLQPRLRCVICKTSSTMAGLCVSVLPPVSWIQLR